MATPDSLLLDEAISKVYHIKSNVATALCLCPDVPDRGPPAADQALACLEHAGQHIQQLQQLAPQIQQLAAAVAQPSSSTGSHPKQQADAWVASVQQRAGQCVQGLQQQVQAAMWTPAGSSLRRLLPPEQQRHHSAHVALLLLLQRVHAAVPDLQVYLFKSSTNQLLFSLTLQTMKTGKPLPLNEQTMYKAISWVDEVRVVCPGVFAASIALTAPGLLEPVRVCVDSVDKASSIDAWSSSKHQAFKRISNLAVRALRHFQMLEAAQQLLHHPAAAAAAPDPSNGDGSGPSSSSSRPAVGFALECLLLWLACYEDLFSRPCAVSGKVIAWEPATAIPLPPVLRPYWLSLDQLTEAASSRTKRQAYHTHLAPWPPAEAAAASAQQPQAGWQQPAAAAGARGGAASGQLQQQQLGAGDVQPGCFLFDDNPLSAAVPAVTDEQLMTQLQDIMAQ